MVSPYQILLIYQISTIRNKIYEYTAIYLDICRRSGNTAKLIKWTEKSVRLIYGLKIYSQIAVGTVKQGAIHSLIK